MNCARMAYDGCKIGFKYFVSVFLFKKIDSAKLCYLFILERISHILFIGNPIQIDQQQSLGNLVNKTLSKWLDEFHDFRDVRSPNNIAKKLQQ